MEGAIRDLCVNDDKVTCTCVLPNHYCVFEMSPFAVQIMKCVGVDVTLGSCATCSGVRYIALSGAPADPQFDTQCILVIQDTSKEVFRHRFPKHILSFRVTPRHVICAFEDGLQVWSHSDRQMVHALKYPLNVHAPIGVSRDFGTIVCTGNNPLDLCAFSIEAKTSASFAAAENPVADVLFSVTPRYYASCSCAGHTVHVWQCGTNQCVVKCKRGNTASVIVSMDFSPDNSFLAVLSQSSTIHIFDLRKGRAGSPPVVRAISTIQLGETGIAVMSWNAPQQIIAATMSGRLVTIILGSKLQEVGREQSDFIGTILEKQTLPM